jgi:hypothetical protein
VESLPQQTSRNTPRTRDHPRPTTGKDYRAPTIQRTSSVFVHKKKFHPLDDATYHQQIYRCDLKPILESILELGCDMECLDYRGRTPLLSVVALSWRSSLALTSFLLSKGADPSTIDYQGSGALHIALSSLASYDRRDPNYCEVWKNRLKVLLKAGCNPHAKDNSGTSPSQIAICSDATVRTVWKLTLQETGWDVQY